jgi:predicted anti-sigma-YlaC factor YlaD
LRSKVSTLPTDCDRAREFVSVQLDGELTEHELDRLETHLRFCPECSAWAERVRDVTLCLREASVEVPADALVLPRHGRTWRVGSAVAVASAAAVVATMFVGPGGHRASVTFRATTAGSRSPDSVGRLLRTPGLQRVEDGRFVAVSGDVRSLAGFRAD